MLGTGLSKTKVITMVIALALPVGWGCKGRQDSVMAQCHEIGRDLITFTNSTRLSGIQPTLQRRLAQFLTAPTRVEAVQLGDEPRPPGDMKATARVFLVNDRKERLGIRVQKEFKSEKYRVVGFWVPEGMNNKEAK